MEEISVSVQRGQSAIKSIAKNIRACVDTYGEEIAQKIEEGGEALIRAW